MRGVLTTYVCELCLLLTFVQLLGIRLKPSEIQAMVDEVDDDGSGELEYKEFVQIMTDLLTKTDTTKGQPASALPFEVTATAYRRCAMVPSLGTAFKADEVVLPTTESQVCQTWHVFPFPSLGPQQQ
jgi:hypothetical protein